ncbi:unnamed protein product [Albugo candida]|uniref:Uncharacterized protein n=1 Tax=Albugo candida TaxID=65357 RepID=A0A024FXP9_9STRA|nr:unnamed protein product [Albugo candida]|eukprot:CCI11429.1 unnamed protein product [Albugo candida]
MDNQSILHSSGDNEVECQLRTCVDQLVDTCTILWSCRQLVKDIANTWSLQFYSWPRLLQRKLSSTTMTHKLAFPIYDFRNRQARNAFSVQNDLLQYYYRLLVNTDRCLSTKM